MKLMLFSVFLAIALVGSSFLLGDALTDQCDQLLFRLSQSDDATWEKDWASFSRLAAFFTPYDIIRTANSNAENYWTLRLSDADPADIDAAREVLKSSIWDIRRVHDLSWELIF